jgi:hypothetical protein
MPITQVTIALSALADPAQVASAGAALAVRLGVALEAMLFEDRRLLQLAEQRLLQRVRWPGGGAETLTAAELESEFLIHRSAMRVALEAAAREAGIDCAIRIVADLPGEQALPVAGGIAVVSEHGLMGHRRDLVRRLLGHVTGLLLLPSNHQPMRRPAVLLESAPRPEFLALALELARRIDAGHPTEIIVAGTAGPQVEAETRRLLVELGVGERTHLLSLAGLPGWSDRLPEPVDSLIVSSSDPANAPGELDPIPDRGRRPVLVLRAGAR